MIQKYDGTACCHVNKHIEDERNQGADRQVVTEYWHMVFQNLHEMKTLTSNILLVLWWSTWISYVISYEMQHMNQQALLITSCSIRLKHVTIHNRKNNDLCWMIRTALLFIRLVTKDLPIAIHNQGVYTKMLLILHYTKV